MRLSWSRMELPFDSRKVLLSLALVLLVGLAVWMVAAQYRSEAGRRQQGVQQARFEEQTGVRIVRVVLAAAGGVVDVHYQVLDSDKALALHDAARPPVVIHEASGALLDQPFHAHVSAARHRVGGLYRLQVLNVGGAVDLGDTVAIVVGDARLDHVVVER